LGALHKPGGTPHRFEGANGGVHTTGDAGSGTVKQLLIAVVGGDHLDELKILWIKKRSKLSFKIKRWAGFLL
jgi:hypothetical protein